MPVSTVAASTSPRESEPLDVRAEKPSVSTPTTPMLPLDVFRLMVPALVRSTDRLPLLAVSDTASRPSRSATSMLPLPVSTVREPV